MSRFSIAGMQLEVHAKDNVDEICSELTSLKRRFPWLDMALAPELASYGAGVKHAQRRGGPAEQAYQAAAREAGLWFIPGSIYETDGADVFNSAPVITPDGEIIARHRKIYPFLPYEKDVATGSSITVFDVPDVGRFGLSICYDMWFPETTRAMACAGAEVILHPSLTNTIDRDAELAIARASAATNQCYFFDINCGPPVGYGRSIVAGPGGEVLHQAGDAKEIIAIDVDLDLVRRIRQEGWNRLGQQLKSFRDTEIDYPIYQERTKAPFLKTLGTLELPGKPKA
ncbi:MAG: carbon-nitrogen hydrolase family protein [Pseudomonadota bacterium]